MNPQNYQTALIGKLRPDPDQPRRSIEEIDLREMAESIITAGVINPIEVDKDFVIVTGERRWRASQIAGLKTVPVKVIDISDDERFMRQVIENIHNETMNYHDTAYALSKLLSLSPRERHPKSPHTGPGADKGETWLSKKIGRSIHYVKDRLDYVDSRKTPEYVQKAVESGELAPTFLRAIKKAPDQHKQEVTKRILAKEFVTAGGAIDFAAALVREAANPQVVKKLLEKDYSKYKTEEGLVTVISKISPELHQIIAKTYEPSKEISKIVEDLKEWVRNNPQTSVGKVHAPRIIINMSFARTLIEEWFQGKKTD